MTAPTMPADEDPFERADAFLSALSAAGLAVVPREMTEAMGQAGANAMKRTIPALWSKRTNGRDQWVSTPSRGGA